MSEMRIDGLGASTPAAYPLRLPHFIISILVAGVDVFAITVACVLSDYVYHLIAYGTEVDPTIGASIGITSAFIFVVLGRSMRLYDLDQLITGVMLSTVTRAWLFSIMLFEAMLFLLKYNPDYSRGALIGFVVTAPLMVAVVRRLLAKMLRTWQANGVVCAVRGIILGTAQELARFKPNDLLRWYGTQELKRYQLPSAKGDGATSDYLVVQDVVEFARRINTDKVLLALPWAEADRRRAIVRELDCLPLDIALLPDAVAQDLLSTQFVPSARLTVELSRAPLSIIERFTKRFIDIVFSLAGVLLLLPVFATIAIAVKMSSPGQILFRQDRVGFNGRTFGIYKFRSMTVTENGKDIKQAGKDDPRLTKVGRILRATSLDELPQLLNVLRGEMSLVGPRPHAVAHDSKYGSAISKYAFRHHVKPGITGWAQVHGLRGPTPELEMMEQRVEHDLWYIANWSIWLDLNILIRTVVEVFRSRNAF